MPEDLNLIVARADIIGSVNVRREAPETATADPGARLLVKFPFKFEELSTADDTFRIQLESSLDGQSAAPAFQESVDRKGRADDVRGFLHQEYDLSAGDHELTFRAVAELRHDGESVKEEVEGTVRITVGQAPL